MGEPETPAVFTAEELGDLHLGDKPRLVPASPLVRLRDTHHWLARALASGMRHGEAAAETGYSISRISILLADPTFQNLVAYYRRKYGDADFTDIMEEKAMMRVAYRRTLRQMIDHYEESDEKGELLPMGHIRENFVALADRLGHGKTQTNVNVDANGLADRMAAARKEYLQRISAAKQPDAVPVPQEDKGDA